VEQPINTIHQRLREFYKDAEHKSGDRRVTLCVEDCFSSLLIWIINAWHGGVLPLAMDATTIDDRFTMLRVSVLFRGMAIPVAWHVLPGNQKGEWREIWLEMLSRFKGVVAKGQAVLVLADRGLYAKWLFQKIVSLGWHPFLRINLGGFFRPDGSTVQALSNFIGSLGDCGGMRGVAFKAKERRLRCTLLTSSQEGMEPLLVLTDLDPDECNALWYRMRFWIEREFKTQKSASMQLQRTRITDPTRLSRLILAISVSMLRAMSEGSQSEDEGQTGETYNIAIAQRERPSGTRGRRTSLYNVGLSILRFAFMRDKRLRPILLRPEPLLRTVAYGNTG
jgi:hypothetical protein